MDEGVGGTPSKSLPGEGPYVWTEMRGVQFLEGEPPEGLRLRVPT